MVTWENPSVKSWTILGMEFYGWAPALAFSLALALGAKK
jgi:hypothetical protein